MVPVHPMQLGRNIHVCPSPSLSPREKLASNHPEHSHEPPASRRIRPSSSRQSITCLMREGRMSQEGIRGASGGARGPGKSVSTQVLATAKKKNSSRVRERESYKRESAVAAHSNLRLVGVDEDLGVASRAATAFTYHDPIVCPPHRLLVNQLDSRLRLGLSNWVSSSLSTVAGCRGGGCCTWRSKSVCSKRGPVMACDRGFWLRDQTPIRLGAWLISTGLDSSTGAGDVSVLVAEGTEASR